MPSIDKSKEIELWRKWKGGDNSVLPELLDSLDPLLQKNIQKFSRAPIPRPALESEARSLAVQAFKTYDPTKAQLNTHVVNHLKHLQRYTLKYQNVGQIPETRGIQIEKFKNVKSNMEETLGREPSLIELADELQWTVPEVERMNKELRSDLLVSEGKEETFFDYTSEDKEEEIIKDSIQFVYYDANNVERKILEYTFGMGGAQKLSIKDMSIRLGISESQIRTISKELAEKINRIRYI